MITARHHLATFAALVALSGLTFALSFVDIGAWSIPAAMAIAGVKVLLVAAVFMHLAEEQVSTRLAGLAAVAWIVILTGFAVTDVSTRQAEPAIPPSVVPPGAER